MNIHPTAIVHPDATISDDAEIQAYTIIGPQVTVGAGTVVGPHCVVEGRTVIGEGNRFFSGAQVGVLSQDLKHRPDLVGRTIIGNNNLFREHTSVSASTMRDEDDEERVTSIGNEGLFMASSHVAHDCHLGNGVIMANCVCLSGHVDIEDKSTLGGLCAVHQECFVGTLSFVGGMARVSKDVPPYMIVEGHSARCIGPNLVGLRRNGFDNEALARIKTIHKILCRSKLNTTQALEEIQNSVDASPERDHFVQFARKSVRGIIT